MLGLSPSKLMSGMGYNFMNKKALVGLIVLVLIAGAIVIFIPKKKSNNTPTPPSPVTQTPTPTPTDNPLDQLKDKLLPTAPKIAYSGKTDKASVLADLKLAGDKEDYVSFAQFLKIVYANNWQTEKDFDSAESAVYVKIDKTYYTPGNYTKSLEITTIVYNQVPASWRFLYLRVLSLESLGRAALAKGDLATAQTDALAILKMTFRLEGTNLLADIYIQKIQVDVAAQNKTQATTDYNYIKDFEVSADRTSKLNQLKVEIDKL